MDNITEVAKFLNDFIGANKKYSINITTKPDETIVSIWAGKRLKRFRHNNLNILMSDLRHSFQVA